MGSKHAVSVDVRDRFCHRVKHQGVIEGSVTAADYQHILVKKIVNRVDKIINAVALVLFKIRNIEFARSIRTKSGANHHCFGPVFAFVGNKLDKAVISFFQAGHFFFHAKRLWI